MGTEHNHPEPGNTGGSWGLTDAWVKAILDEIKPAAFVDFGCGKGKYGKMLAHVPFSVGLDCFQPTVDWLNTTHIYDDVACGSLVDHPWLIKPPITEHTHPIVAIFGDVLEHLHHEEIVQTLGTVRDAHWYDYVVIVVPLDEKPQGESGGNEAERHLTTITEDWLCRLVETIGYTIHAKHVTTAESKTGPYSKMALILRVPQS